MKNGVGRAKPREIRPLGGNLGAPLDGTRIFEWLCPAPIRLGRGISPVLSCPVERRGDSEEESAPPDRLVGPPEECLVPGVVIPGTEVALIALASNQIKFWIIFSEIFLLQIRIELHL